jgi:hypothetical protein
MDKLVSVIGLAPSELSHPDLLAKVRTERERVRRAIELFKTRKVGGGGKKKGLTKTAIAKILKESGLTAGELDNFLKKEKERRETNEIQDA